LFRQLAQLEKAGFHADKAFALITDTNKALTARLHAIQSHLKAGKPIAEAGFKAGLFNEVQQSLLHAAESSGTLATVYFRLANHYATRAQRLRKIKTQCYFPALLLIISLFLQPLPALVAADITLLQYLQLSAGKLALLAFAVYFAVRLPYILSHMGLTAVFHRVQLQLPLVSDWIIKRQLNEFYHNLALLLAAGLAFSEALPKAVAGIPNSTLQ